MRNTNSTLLRYRKYNIKRQQRNSISNYGKLKNIIKNVALCIIKKVVIYIVFKKAVPVIIWWFNKFGD